MATHPSSTADSTKSGQRSKPAAPGSFYIVVDSYNPGAVRAACVSLKTLLSSFPEVRVRGPKAMPNVRRRYMVMREMVSAETHLPLYMNNPVRYRCVLLITHPTPECIQGLTSHILPSETNIRIEAYANQYNLREDR